MARNVIPSDGYTERFVCVGRNNRAVVQVVKPCGELELAILIFVNSYQLQQVGISANDLASTRTPDFVVCTSNFANLPRTVKRLR